MRSGKCDAFMLSYCAENSRLPSARIDSDPEGGRRAHNVAHAMSVSWEFLNDHGWSAYTRRRVPC